MKISSLTAVAFFLTATPVCAADDVLLQRLAICQDSWFDWQKSDPAKLPVLGKHIGAGFTHRDNDPFAVPKAETSIMGLRVTQVFPQSVGMGVGFSITVAAPLDAVRKDVEKLLGKTLQHCEASDGMKACDLQIADKRTVTIMAADPPDKNGTLVGCYYFYEK